MSNAGDFVDFLATFCTRTKLLGEIGRAEAATTDATAERRVQLTGWLWNHRDVDVTGVGVRVLPQCIRSVSPSSAKPAKS